MSTSAIILWPLGVDRSRYWEKYNAKANSVQKWCISGKPVLWRFFCSSLFFTHTTYSKIRLTRKGKPGHTVNSNCSLQIFFSSCAGDSFLYTRFFCLYFILLLKDKVVNSISAKTNLFHIQLFLDYKEKNQFGI